MRAARVLLPVLALAVLRAEPGPAETYLVLPDGSGDFPNIQAAVDSVADGDEILLGDGTFQGDGNADVDYRGKAVTIRSASGNPATCTVLADAISFDGRAGFLFRTGEGPGSVLSGVTIRGAGIGYVPNDHGAIYCEGTSPAIRDVHVTDGRRGLVIVGGASPDIDHVRLTFCEGPAVRVEDSAPTLTGCVIESNTATHTGGAGVGGVALHASSAVLDSCVVQNNGGLWAGGVHVWGASPTFRDCVVVNNQSDAAGGFSISGASTPLLLRTTVARNASAAAGGLDVQGGSLVTLEQTIVWGNCGYGWEEIALAPGCFLDVACSDLRLAQVGGGGTLNLVDVIDFPPMYCAPRSCGVYFGPAGSYHVDEDSQVILAACGPMGALAADCDIGLEPETWGRLKALFR